MVLVTIVFDFHELSFFSSGLCSFVFACSGSGTPERPKSNSIITQSGKNVSAQAGLCVVLACSFTTQDGDVENITWYKHDGNITKTIFGSSNNTKTEPEFEGRVSLLEADLKKNCSIIINDLTKSDSGSYHAVAKTKTHCTLIANITVTVTGIKTYHKYSLHSDHVIMFDLNELAQLNYNELY